jgi:hypothetical protein
MSEEVHSFYYYVVVTFTTIPNGRSAEDVKAKMLADLKEVFRQTYDTHTYGFVGGFDIRETQPILITKPKKTQELDFLE